MSDIKKNDTQLYIQATRQLISGDVDSDRLARFESTGISDTSNDAQGILKELQAKGLVTFVQSKKPAQQQPPAANFSTYVKEKLKEIEIKDNSVANKFSDLHEKRKLAMRQRLAGEHEQRMKNHETIAQYISQFDECHNQSLPLDMIYTECFRSNELRLSGETLRVCKSISTKINSKITHYYQQSNLIDEDRYYYQYEEEESEVGNQLRREMDRDQFLMRTMHQGNPFFQIMSHFLREVASKIDSLDQIRKTLSASIPDKVNYGKLPIGLRIQTNLEDSVFNTDIVYEQPFNIVPSIISEQFINGERILEKEANKRNGTTLKFHQKVFSLTGNQLLYYKLKDKNNGKTITLIVPQLLELISIEKEVRVNWISHEKQPTMIYILKGHERNVEIEHNQWEGMEMYRQLVLYFAIKAYQYYCCTFYVAESKFQEFIRNRECKELDLSDNTMKMKDARMVYSSLSQFVHLFEIMVKVLEFNKQVEKVNLKASGLRIECIEAILNKIEKEMPNLIGFDISYNSLSSQVLRKYLACLKQMKEVKKIQLSHCAVGDSLIGFITDPTNTYISRMKHIDLSYNNLTYMSVPSIVKALHKVSACKLIIDGNKLGDSSLPQFLSNNIELTKLSMKNCSLNLDQSNISAVISKLSQNTILRRLHLSQNKVSFSHQTFRMVLSVNEYLEEISLDVPISYYLSYEVDISDWTIDLD